jgi:hypothetical protein
VARLVLVLDVTAEPNLWDPHEVIEDILAHAEELPTFEPGMAWFLTQPDGIGIQEGTFVSCEWEDEDDAAAED